MKETSTIDPNSTLINRAVRYQFFVANPLMRLIFLLVWLGGVYSVGYLILHAAGFSSMGSETAEFGLETAVASDANLGLYYLLLGIFCAYLPIRAFYKEKVLSPKLIDLTAAKKKVTAGESINLFALFSLELAKATRRLFARNQNPPSKDFILAILGSRDLNFVLNRLGLPRDYFSQLIINYEGNKSVDGGVLIKRALEIAAAESHHQIEVGDVFIALCQSDPYLQKVISDLKIETVDIAHIVYWQTSLIRRSLKGKRFLDPDRLKLTGGVGRDWAFGYTPFMQRYSRDITDSVANLGLEVIGHDKEIDEIKEALLRQNGGNVVLVGEAGTGKRTTVLGLAKKIAEGDIDEGLAFKHIFEINVESLLAGYQNKGEVVDRLSTLLSEAANAGNIIVFIDKIQTLLSDSDAGSVNATEVILPFLEAPSVHLIATCDVAEYNRLIANNGALNERLTRITVEEPNEGELVRILADATSQIEYQTGSFITYEAIKETAKAADKYIQNLPNPEKSINLLDGAAAHAASKKGKSLITPADILDYVTVKYDVPAAEANEGEKEKLLNLDQEMHKQVIGQDQAIKAIAGSLRRARAGIVDSKKPIGSFLFLGPTGVGKTETAKALANAYFGSIERMIRFDMSEFQNKEDIYRFIGSSIGGEDAQGVLSVAVREHPFSLLLFDEIEKANRDILDLFLQILDEGHMTDGQGKKVSFTNTIIICTSNAGASLIREAISSGTDYEKTKSALLDYLQKENVYRPEFINRFTSVVAFSPLSQQQIIQVAGLMITHLQATVLKNKGINIAIAPDALAKLAEMGFDPQMGARPMARVIEEKVENWLATKILANELKKGDAVTLQVADIA